MSVLQRVQQLLEPVVVGMGYEFVGVEIPADTHGQTLRIYIDTDDGVTVDDCERVSRQVSAVLDVEDVMRGHYNLEVSSPGLDRPLFSLEDFRRFAGRVVRVRLKQALAGRRNIEGEIEGVAENGTVEVRENGVSHQIPIDSIARARLRPDF